MTTAVSVPLRFTIGARTLWELRRRLVRVPLSLQAVLADHVPALPPIGEADGWSVTSLPAARLPALAAAAPGALLFVRQRYTRYHIDLAAGFERWWQGLSANQRATLKRKTKRIVGGDAAPDVRACRTPAELEAFHAVARAISRTTYQERLMGAGLPETAAFFAGMLEAAAAGRVRAWLLFVEGVPAAYLYCPVRGRSVIYEHVGHDPRFADLSPGAVLQLAAMRDLFADPGGAAWFDFTEGEGQHKRTMASGGTPCVDVLLLRPTIANRAGIAALSAFDRAVAGAKRLIARAGAKGLTRRLRRG